MKPDAVIAAWPELAPLDIEPLSGGLINDTWRIGEPPRAVLQRLHTIFRPELHGDIDAVTRHLAARGMPTPRLVPAGDGSLFQLDGDDRCWRVLDWVPGRTIERLTKPALAREAGALVARWHRATDDLEHVFAFTRPGAHDTEAHMASVMAAMAAHRGHRLRDRVAPVAEELHRRWAAWQGELLGEERIAHGDLKISNLRFDDDGRGLCLLDLDTIGHLPLDIELGDAWRSWCNPGGEDAAGARFDGQLFEASARGYLSEKPVAAELRETLVAGVERICLELAARFAADALNEAYFGWNPAVAPLRGEHNLLRAEGQLALAQSVADQRAALEDIVRTA